MARSRSSYLNELSTADLKQLLEARQRIDVLEKEKARLAKELAAVEAELDRLVAGVEKPARKAAPATTAAGATRRKKAVKKKAAKKKAAKKKAATATKAAGKKTVKKKAVAGKAAGKPAARKKAGPRAGQPKLEDIVLKIIKSQGGTVSYQDLLGAITKGKLFTSKSKNFDNVLRRTLSTSKLVKRTGRGIYEAA